MSTPSIQPSVGNPTPVLSSEEQKQLTSPTDKWSPRQAAAIALGDWEKAENYWNQNLAKRIRTSDELYLAWRQKKVWEGTKIPRASIPIFLALEQIEALLPSVIGALFSDNLNFDCEPRPSSTWEQAHAVRDLLRYQLSDISDKRGAYITIREVVRRALKSSLVYGNGIIEVGYLMQQIQRVLWQKQMLPRRQMLQHPQFGPMMAPTGELDIHIVQSTVTDNISKPTLQFTDIRDFRIDPNCYSPNVQDAEYCGTRHFRTIEWLKDMAKSDARIQLPSDKDLIELAHRKTNTQSDATKSQTEVARGNFWQPNTDQSIDPNKQRLEIIRYWQSTRHVWVIRGYNDCPIYNEANETHMLPFLDAFHVDVPGRFYGLSICDLVEGDQKLAASILEARIDELNLMIHAPIVRRRGTMLPGTDRRMRPGAIWETEGSPKDDIVRMEMGNVTAQAFVEIQALENRVQKYTGVTDLATLGTPASGGNSANRTATGVNTQSAASGKRIQYHVENIEDQCIVPLLNMVHSLNQRFLSPDQMIPILGQDAQRVDLDPLDILNADVKFEMKASSKLRMRSALQAGALEMLLQTVFNPSLLQLMAKAGKTVNLDGINSLLTDAWGIPKGILWTDLTPELMQSLQQPSPDKMLASQMQQSRLQAQGEHNESKADTSLLQTVIGGVIQNEGLQKAATGFNPVLPQPDKNKK
jgi:hypothetical protein